MLTEPKINEEVLKKGGLPHLKFFNNIAELPYVEAIYLFGSRARGDHWEKSDIDLAIKYNDDDVMHRRVVKAIVNEVKDTLLEVDVIDYNEKLSKEFRKCMDEEKVVLYEKA